MWRVATDTGGTFTDVVAIGDGGETLVAKVPSTPPNFQTGVLNGLRELGSTLEAPPVLYHGTTVTTNALLTRTGARTAVIATRGFRDLLEIRRGNREDVYDILWDQPPPLVPRFNRLEVTERLNYRGEVLVPLDEKDVQNIVRILRKREIEALAISFLHSYVNPIHERRVAEIIAEELPEIYISTSHTVLPEPPEFDRTSVATASAYVGPILRRYLERLQAALKSSGHSSNVLMMHSGGGMISAEAALQIPIRTAASGPAAGVVAAATIAKNIGRRHVLSLDMGGTSADIATIRDGEPRLSVHHEIEWGMPLGFPCIDLAVIGAGGGSIAWMDPGGAPRSGPQSAGSIPGPACYGQGGSEPTTTDANLVLGRLSSEALLGGRLRIDSALAHEAIKRRIADPLELGVHIAANGILRIATEAMINAIRRLTVRRGLDPREFTLVAFGGAGPMHAVEIAMGLEMKEVIIPPSPGATSALGLLFVDSVHDFSRSYIAPCEAVAYPEVDRQFREMEQEGLMVLRGEGFSGQAIQLTRALDLRYMGQLRAVTVDVPSGDFTTEVLRKAVESFHREYASEFTYAMPDMPVELRTLRISARGVRPKPRLAGVDRRTTRSHRAEPCKRDVYFGDATGFSTTSVYQRDRLPPGFIADGPAVIEQFDATTVLPPGAQGEVDEFGNLIVTMHL